MVSSQSPKSRINIHLVYSLMYRKWVDTYIYYLTPLLGQVRIILKVEINFFLNQERIILKIYTNYYGLVKDPVPCYYNVVFFLSIEEYTIIVHVHSRYSHAAVSLVIKSNI